MRGGGGVWPHLQLQCWEIDICHHLCAGMLHLVEEGEGGEEEEKEEEEE